MSGRAILKGATDQSTIIRIFDNTTTLPDTGITSASAGLALSYRREGGAVVALTAANDLAAVDSAHNDGGLIHIGAGYYRVDPQDGAYATGSTGVLVFGVATGKTIIGTYHSLVNFSLEGQSASDLKDFADDGYDPSTNKVQGVVLTDTVTTYTGNTPQTGDSFARLGAPAGASVSADIADVEGKVDDLESRLGTPANLGGGATIAQNLADIEAQTDDIGSAGAGLTAVPWNSAWDTEVQSEVDDALVAQNLDHLVKIAVDTNFATTVHADSVIGQLADNGAGFDRTTDSLEAIRDHATTIKTETASIQVDTDAIEADTQDIQSRLPAALVSGRIDASVGAMASDTITAAAIADNAIDAGAIAANALTSAKFASGAFDAVWSVGTRLLTAGTNIVLAKGVGVTGFTDISASQVNAEVVDALATDTYAEPTGVPPATATLAVKIGTVYMALRNKLTITSSKKTFFDDSDNAEWEKDLSDNGTTYTESEGNSV